MGGNKYNMPQAEYYDLMTDPYRSTWNMFLYSQWTGENRVILNPTISNTRIIENENTRG